MSNLLSLEQIIAVRKANRIQQKEFGELMGLAGNTWGAIESGSNALYVDRQILACKIIKDYDLDTSVLDDPERMAALPGKIYKRRGDFQVPDARYLIPKKEPLVDEETVKKVIGDNEIYRSARSLMNRAQSRQVAYGLQKYPEPLNADTWSTIETLDHIIEESVDKLHYLVMLRIKLEREGLEREGFRHDESSADGEV